jgi:biotin operon repressor
MKIEDRTIVVERFLKRESQASIARDYGCSREAVRQIVARALGDEMMQKLYHNWEIDDANYIQALINENPSWSLEELGEITGTSAGKVRTLIKKYNIKRDHNVRSDRITIAKAKGRVPLTKDLLTYLYLQRDLTAPMISHETGYSPVTINKYIQKFRLLKRPEAANVNHNRVKF